MSYAERGLDVVRVRPFNHTGAGQSDVFVASSFARQLVEIERGTRAGRARTSATSIRCAISSTSPTWSTPTPLLCDPRVPADAYNVASGRGARAGALLERLCALARLSPRIEVDAARLRPTD